jgi:hypothetical protein
VVVLFFCLFASALWLLRRSSFSSAEADPFKQPSEENGKTLTPKPKQKEEDAKEEEAELARYDFLRLRRMPYADHIATMSDSL